MLEVLRVAGKPLGDLQFVQGPQQADVLDVSGVRDVLASSVESLDADEAALLLGLVIGDDSDQPEAMVEAFRHAGLSHLTAVSGQNVAFLVALFKARPSPFYVLDEVEAALDDVNLGRLIDIIEELRDSSQLIVITHQKRTMEIADALYGVSMRGDGVTQVIGQRLREAATA